MRKIARLERFGAVVQPPLTRALLFFAVPGRKIERPLSAPLEAHLSITSRCPNNCPHCYESSGTGREDPGLSFWKASIDTLASMGVFHVAIGGGEPAIVPWLFELAGHARSRGIVPNLTTSGAGVDAEWAKRSGVFGQVNVSFDGAASPRPEPVVRQSAEALRILSRQRDDVGINCVITRRNFGLLDDICSFAKGLGLSEVEFLRFKPSGRATGMFEELDLLPEMYASLVKTVERLMIRHRLRIKLDCSFVPAVASAGIRPALMRFFGASGCEGGNELCAVGPSGLVSGCSFAPRGECDIGSLDQRWNEPGAFSEFRRWEERGNRVCLECRWFNVCRGGCHVVAEHVTGSWHAPDPSCALAGVSG